MSCDPSYHIDGYGTGERSMNKVSFMQLLNLYWDTKMEYGQIDDQYTSVLVHGSKKKVVFHVPVSESKRKATGFLSGLCPHKVLEALRKGWAEQMWFCRKHSPENNLNWCPYCFHKFK